MFKSKKQNCKSCGKEINVYEKAWVLMPFPAKGLVNPQKLIEFEGQLYCKECVVVK
ncbi:hypothetical protein [Bacillus cereus]|uniref:hypothetical protein n=1 Tax=Bacillus cereus TaxID=1396 RepID=UPI0018799987|nr:hypothetical protein [Bacillus cereus]